jgi:hypothetical protein
MAVRREGAKGPRRAPKEYPLGRGSGGDYLAVFFRGAAFTGRLTAFFFTLGRLLPNDLLAIFPRRVRLSPRPMRPSPLR